MEYQCPDSNCKHDGNEPYHLSIPAEVCEPNNMAPPMCPHCGQKLEKTGETTK